MKHRTQIWQDFRLRWFIHLYFSETYDSMWISVLLATRKICDCVKNKRCVPDNLNTRLLPQSG